MAEDLPEQLDTSLSPAGDSPGWFHVFKARIHRGDLAKLPSGAVATLLCVKAHSNHHTGVCDVGIDRLSQLSGRGPRQVMRDLDALEKAGWMTRGRKGRKNRYQIQEQFRVDDAGDSIAKWPYVPSGVRELTNLFKQQNGLRLPDGLRRLNVTVERTERVEITYEVSVENGAFEPVPMPPGVALKEAAKLPPKFGSLAKRVERIYGMDDTPDT